MDFSKRELRLRKVLCSLGMLSMVLFASCEKDDVMKEMDSDSSQEKMEESSLNYRALFSTDHKIGVDEAKELALYASSLFSKDGSDFDYSYVSDSKDNYQYKVTMLPCYR